MIDTVWNRIVDNEGNIFTQIKGKEFKYKIKANGIELSTTNRIIPKSDIKRALEKVPFENTVILQELKVQGPSYVFSIIMDKRIRMDNW